MAIVESYVLASCEFNEANVFLFMESSGSY